jgi:hypothetical protein
MAQLREIERAALSTRFANILPKRRAVLDQQASPVTDILEDQYQSDRWEEY